MATIAATIRWADNTEQLRRNLDQGLDQIEAITKSANKLALAYGGDALIRAAHSHAAAIQQIGGVTKLTSAEKDRLNTILSKSLEKYAALGRTAPTALVELERATRRAEAATGKNGLMGQVELLRRAFVGLQVARFAKGALDAAGRMTDLSSSTGLSVRELGRLQAAGTLTGVSLDAIAKGAVRLQDELMGGNKGAVNAVRRLGLDLDALRAMTPGQLFETIAAAVARIEDPMLRTHLNMELFGRRGAELMSLFRADISKVADEAERTGQVMDEKMVASLDEASDRLDKFTNQVNVLVGGPLALLSSLIEKGSTKWTNFATGADLAWAALKRLYTVFGSAPPMPKLPSMPAGLLPEKIGDPAGMPGADVLVRQMEEQKKAAGEAAKAADHYRQKIRGLADDLSGTKLAQEVRDVNAAIAAVQLHGPLSAAAIDRIGDKASALSKQGAILTGELLNVWIAQERWKNGMPKVERGLGGIIGRTEDLWKSLRKLHDVDVSGIRSILSVGGISDIMGNLPGQKIELAPPTVASRSFADFFKNNMGGLVTGAFQGGGNVAKSLLSGIGSFLGSSGTNGSTVGNKMAGFLTKALGSNLGKFATSLLPGIGSLIGPLATKLFGGLFGKSKGALLDAQATTQIKDLQGELLKTHGSLDKIRAMGKVVGVDLAAAWGDRSQAGLKHFTALMDEFHEKQERLQGALERYGLTWLDLGDQARQAHLDQVAADLIADFDILKTAGMDVTKIVGGMSGAINTFVTDALTTGATIPPAMQPMIEQLIRTGQLTEQNAALLLGLQHEAVPAWADIKGAAERYGIALDALGPKIEQIRITEEAAQIVKDWEFLVGAGADAGAVMAGMADEVQTLIDAALRTGLSLPASMKPMLEQMVDAGLLTDLTGEKLTGLSGLNFAEPLAASVDRLIEALDRLIASLNGDVNKALDNVARDRDFVVRGRVEFDPRTQTPGASTGLEAAHSGALVTATGIQRHHQGTARILRFHSGVANLASDEVPAILQVGESVLNRRATQQIGPDAIRAINSGRTGGAGGGVTRVEVRTAALEQGIADLRQDVRDQSDRTYRAIRDALAQGAA